MSSRTISRLNSRLPLINILLVVIVILGFLSLLIGPAKIQASKLLISLIPGNSDASNIIWQIRIPRILLASLAGAVLSGAGCIILGITGHALIDSIASKIVFGGGVVFAAIVLIAMAFGIKLSPEVYILVGTLSGATWVNVFNLTPFIIIGVLISIYYSKDLNAVVFGEYTAKTLGIDYGPTRVFLLSIAGLLAMVALPVCGIPGLVALITPYFIRMSAGYNYKYLIPVSMLAGIAAMLFIDVLSRIIFPSEVPLGIIISLLFCPLYVYALYRRRLGH
jgi:iron complex transport system permease protein